MNDSEFNYIQENIIKSKGAVVLFVINLLSSMNEILTGLGRFWNNSFMVSDVALRYYQYRDGLHFLEEIKRKEVEVTTNVTKLLGDVRSWEDRAYSILPLEVDKDIFIRFRDTAYFEFFKHFDSLYQGDSGPMEKDDKWKKLLNLLDLSKADWLNEDKRLKSWLKEFKRDFLNSGRVSFIMRNGMLFSTSLSISRENVPYFMDMVKSYSENSIVSEATPFYKLRGLCILIERVIQESF